VKNLQERGVEFLELPSIYYDKLRKAIERGPVKPKENIDEI
jgi:4-hydroxyphenylpyruvate dioxygenase-like putative hemolysin